MQLPKLAIVLPCYNEEQVLPDSILKLKDLLGKMITSQQVSSESYLFFIDDGSRDTTWQIIEQEHVLAPNSVKGLKFSRNFGHQNAILAGMNELKDEVDCVITIDVDLQDDLEVIPKMIADFTSGVQIVYGVRDQRKTDTFFKKWTAQFYYSFLKFMGVEVIYNHADFRLVGSQALHALSQYRETNLFLRGIFPVLGFKTSIIYYNRAERLAGETKYTFSKMMGLAMNGITSFSHKPLKIAMFIGLITIFGVIVGSIWALYAKMVGLAVPGWTSTVLPIYLMGGVNLFFMGVIGEYVGKIYSEVKQRPKYIVDKKL